MEKLTEEGLAQVSGGMDTYAKNPRGSSVHIYRLADPTSKILYTVPNGQQLFKTGNMILIGSVTWYEVQIPWHADTGWVQSDDIYDTF